MQKQLVLDHVANRLHAVLDQWDVLCRCADYGIVPAIGQQWGGVRESTLETIARSMLAAVPLIVNRREVANASLSSFYAAQILSLALNPMFAPRHDRFDQATVEVAGLCACLLTLETFGLDILAELSTAQQHLVVRWVQQYRRAVVMNNNWLMFLLIIDAWVGKRTDVHRTDVAAAQAGLWQRLDGFYVGNGHYRDGPAGAVDYYTGWSFQWYSLILVLAGCTSDAVTRTVRERAVKFADVMSAQLQHGPLPVVGRSQCYREAASAALALVALVAQPMPGGNQLLETNWRQWENSTGFDGVQREYYSCSASPMWRFKWYWQALLPDEDAWWL